MKAEDTVMEIGNTERLLVANDLNAIKDLVMIQAGISFKAGYDLGYDNAIMKDAEPWCDGHQKGMRKW